MKCCGQVEHVAPGRRIILTRTPSVHNISSKSVHNFLRYFVHADTQTSTKTLRLSVFGAMQTAQCKWRNGAMQTAQYRKPTHFLGDVKTDLLKSGWAFAFPFALHWLRLWFVYVYVHYVVVRFYNDNDLIVAGVCWRVDSRCGSNAKAADAELCKSVGKGLRRFLLRLVLLVRLRSNFQLFAWRRQQVGPIQRHLTIVLNVTVSGALVRTWDLRLKV